MHLSESTTACPVPAPGGRYFTKEKKKVYSASQKIRARLARFMQYVVQGAETC